MQPLMQDQTAARVSGVSAVGCASLDFTPPQEYGVGLQSAGAAHAPVATAADMNSDGNPDIVQVETAGVSVLLGDGVGGFGLPLTVSASSNNYWLANSDFNRDGKTDVATVNSVFLGNGNGTLQSGLPFTAGVDPTFVVVGDWNSDGKLDLAVSELRAFVVWVLIGNGDGTFQPPVSYDVGPLPTSVSWGDVNGDGHVDLVVTEAPKALPQEDGPGSGFAECGGESTGGGPPVGAPQSSQTRQTATFTYGDSPNMTILFGNGDGTFQYAYNFGNSGISLQAVVYDFNGDGKLDIADMNIGEIRMRFGNGDGTFQPPIVYQTGLCSKALYGYDFNKDGKLDLITADQGSRNVSIFIGNGDGTFLAPQAFNVWRSPISVAVADFNRDGWLDLAVPHLEQNNPTLPTGTAVRLGNTAKVPPTISGGTASPSTLSPANHQFVDVTIAYTASDNCDTSITSSLTVTSNEPISGTGGGDKSPDWQIVDAHHVKLRAEKALGGNGRVYTITIDCVDLDGNHARRQVQVTVP